MKMASFATVGPPIVLPATENQKAVVVFLHHVGVNGQHWAKRFENMRLPHIKYIFPNAPVRKFTVWDTQTTAWYDVHAFNNKAPIDDESLNEALAKMHCLLDEIIESGTPSNRIIIAGYSLGGCLAISAMLTYDKTLSGCVILNAVAADHRPASERRIVEANRNTPILHLQGDKDPFIAREFAEETHVRLKATNVNHTFQVFSNKTHWPTAEMFEAMKTFIADHTKFEDEKSEQENEETPEKTKGSCCEEHSSHAQQ